MTRGRALHGGGRASTSACVTVPPRPVPCTWLMSTPSCLARCRMGGVGGHLGRCGCGWPAAARVPARLGRRALGARRGRWVPVLRRACAIAAGAITASGVPTGTSLPGSTRMRADHSALEALHFDGRLVGVHDGDDVALAYLVAGLDQPFEQRSLVHVRAERRHQELGHVSRPPSARRPRSWPAAARRPPPGATRTESALPRCRPVRPARPGRRTPAR